MEKVRQYQFLVVLTLLILISVSCDAGKRLDCILRGGTYWEDDPDEHYCYFADSPQKKDGRNISDDKPIPNSCDATQYLQTSTAITKQETNQYGTRLCEYTLTITNTHDTDAVRYNDNIHQVDGYQNTDTFDWMGGFSIAPGMQDAWTASIAIYTDPDASGPVMSIPEELAGLYDIPECEKYRIDDNFKDSVARNLSSPCPLK